jgi:hypothetical protein
MLGHLSGGEQPVIGRHGCLGRQVHSPRG